MPKAVRDGVNDYRREMDVLSEFIEDRCELSGNADAKTLYACYCDWCDENSEDTMSATRFGREMGKRFERKRVTQGVYYNGISLAYKHSYRIKFKS